jgi:N-acetyl-anhydromuramyl-L-alanine amidase AmpD
MRLLRYGLTGEDVKEWQLVLKDSGYDLEADGHFGGITHNTTKSWQKERGLEDDGIVGNKTRAKIGTKPSVTLSNPLEEELNIKFKQARNYTPSDRTDIRWIVIHSMEAGEASTTAENVAGWFAGSSAPKASAHYSIVQSVKEHDIAWHAGGGNRYGIGLEHAGYARQTRNQWLDAFSMRMLKRSAKLTADICKRWDIPVKYVDRAGLKRGEYGITYHREITYAFRKSTHVDPGKNFPMDLYLQWVQEAMDS